MNSAFDQPRFFRKADSSTKRNPALSFCVAVNKQKDSLNFNEIRELHRSYQNARSTTAQNTLYLLLAVYFGKPSVFYYTCPTGNVKGDSSRARYFIRIQQTGPVFVNKLTSPAESVCRNINSYCCQFGFTSFAMRYCMVNCVHKNRYVCG